MSMRPIFLLSSACLLAMFASIWTFAAGYGLIAAFMVYSLGGSVLVVAFAAISFIRIPSQPKFDEERESFSCARNAVTA